MEKQKIEWVRPYIAALVDNHSGIVVTVGKASDRAVGYRIAIECRIKTESTESIELLAEFCDEVGVKYRTKEQTDREYTSYELVIGRRNSVQTFLLELHPYLVVRNEAVEILCETIIPSLEQGKHNNKQSFLQLFEHIERFREEVGRANRAKYNMSHFKQEWDLEP
ncbi:hypothetical protein ACFQL1_24375 [Halomicroarcula sp. GCM10025709]|uniref:hypothetical protein n=1 Tax=Haloarcula TaxID=2237 RepID=UPI0024C219E1|nr:hypothetical protein [Halomicroarcula sp. YJ-61-S]